MSGYGKLMQIKKLRSTVWDASPAERAQTAEYGLSTGKGSGMILPSGSSYRQGVEVENPDPELLAKIRRECSEYHRKNVSASFARGRLSVMSGSDPEIFALNGRGRVLPAWKFLPSKDEVKGLHEKPYWDGAQAEWTIPPDNCHSYVVDTVRTGLQRVLEAAQRKDAKAKLTWEPVLAIPYNTRKAAKPEHIILGCAPSENGYNIRPVLPDGEATRALKIRFAGFHIHLGFDGGIEPEIARHVVKQLDRVVAVMFVAVLADMDNPVRRQFYGQAGEYRLPKHGIEYRVLSSTVMAHPVLTHLAFDMARLVAMYACTGVSLINAEDERVRDIINNCNVDEARKLMAENNDFYTSANVALYAEQGWGDGTKAFSALLDKGAKQIMPVDDMSAQWQLRSDDFWKGHSESNNACMRKLVLK